MAILLGDVLRWVLPMRYRGQIYQMVFDTIIGGTDVEEDSVVLGAVADFLDDVVAFVRPYMSTGLVFDPYVVSNLSQDNIPLGTVIGGITGFTGNDNGTPLPTGNAALVSFATGAKRVTGKKYVPTMSESNWDGAAWSSALMGALGNFGAALLELVNFGQDDQGTIRYCISRIVEGVLTSTTFPTSATARSDGSYQRRRKIGLGM